MLTKFLLPYHLPYVPKLHIFIAMCSEVVIHIMQFNKHFALCKFASCSGCMTFFKGGLMVIIDIGHKMVCCVTLEIGSCSALLVMQATDSQDKINVEVSFLGAKL